MSERCTREELTAAGIPVIELPQPKPEPVNEGERFSNAVEAVCVFLETARREQFINFIRAFNEKLTEYADRLERQGKEPQ